MMPPLTPPQSTGDEELDSIFADAPELLSTARIARAAVPQAVPDDIYRRRLRAQLVEAATARNSRSSWWRRRGGTLPALFAGGLGSALVAATVILVVANPTGGSTVPTWTTPAVANVSDANPDQAIQVSFNQPMDEQTVVAGLHIEPAAAVTTSWQGNTLVITPAHPLSANTPYTVTIDKTAVKTASGQAAPAALTFSFGTAATPSASPTPAVTGPAQLAPVTIATVGSPAIVGFAPDGAPIVNGTASAASSPSATATASATTSATSWVIPTNAPITPLGAPISATRLSPDGTQLLVAEDATGGASQLLTVAFDGSDNPTVTPLVTIPARVVSLAWTGHATFDAVTAQSVISVDAAHQLHTLVAAPENDSFVSISATARFVAATGPSGSRVVDLSDATFSDLPAASDVTWSGDGSSAAWLDANGVEVATSGHFAQTPQNVATTLPGAPAGLALNRDGSEIAVWDSTGNLQLLDRTGKVLATATGVGDFVFTPTAAGGVIAALPAADGTAAVETVVLPTATASATSEVPAAALTTLDEYVAAELGGNSATLAAIAPGVQTAVPTGATRSYIVSATPASATTVAADVRLVTDPTSKNPATYVEESITLTAASDGTYTVTALTVAAPIAEPSGPHVIHVDSEHGSDVITVAFDSDLNPDSVASALTVTVDAKPIPVTVSYDPTTRTATVTVTTATTGRRVLHVATTLVDINGQQLASAYRERLN